MEHGNSLAPHNFSNASILDFSLAENRAALAAAIAESHDRFMNQPAQALPSYRGKSLATEKTLPSINPSNPAETLGEVGLATDEAVNNTLEELHRSRQVWNQTPAQTRANIIREAAHQMLARRHELTALIVLEAGKPWMEADADLIEAVDFCHYYAALVEERYSIAERTIHVLGEDNRLGYRPRGVCAVISPWNFPLAICCGMTSAALVTGNAALMKPSSQTALIAHEFFQILLQAGVPSECLAFLPCSGSRTGRLLVESPFTDVIAFTGSKEVGLEIIRRAAVVHEGQRNVKRVIAEMGGKNAIIIDEDADLDEAVKGAVYSAFAYAGQKCSACSRIVVVGEAYEPFLTRFALAARDLLTGDARDPSTFLGPVIDEAAATRLKKAIREAEKEHAAAFVGKEVPSLGYHVAPAVFRDVDERSSLWNEELFGPVVACRQAKDFTDALRLANTSAYALTGGVFSRSPGNIALARDNFEVGNLYINRSCTGAVVCRQPFGGSRMSGIGSKAGGPDYLLQFMDPYTVSENTMRRGFSPDLID